MATIVLQRETVPIIPASDSPFAMATAAWREFKAGGARHKRLLPVHNVLVELLRPFGKGRAEVLLAASRHPCSRVRAKAVLSQAVTGSRSLPHCDLTAADAREICLVASLAMPDVRVVLTTHGGKRRVAFQDGREADAARDQGFVEWRQEEGVLVSSSSGAPASD